MVRKTQAASGASSRTPSHEAGSTVAQVLLQADLPGPREIRQQFPGATVNTLLGYRRRAWRAHGISVLRGRRGEPVDIPINDCPFYTVQTNGMVPVPNINTGRCARSS